MFRKPKAIQPVVKTFLSLTVLCLIAALDGAGQTGSAREAFKGSAEFRDSVADAASSIEKYAGQLERSSRSLDKLGRSGGEVQKRYGSFSEDLRKLEKAQKSAVAAVDKMRQRESEYFAAWDKANMQIGDPTLRGAAADRRYRVMSEYQPLADDLGAVGRELQPFMSHLRDLDLFLGADRSRENVKEAAAMIDGSRAEAERLKHRIADAQRGLKDFLEQSLGGS